MTSWQRMRIILGTELFLVEPHCTCCFLDELARNELFFRSHSISVSDEWLHKAWLRLETAKLAFKEVTQQWTEVYDLLSLVTSMTSIAAPGYNAFRVQDRSLAFNRLCTSAQGLMTHHFSEHEAWNCRLAPGCKLHPVLLTQIYYWALLFCKQRVQFYLRIWPWCLSAERVFYILFCIKYR